MEIGAALRIVKITHALIHVVVIAQVVSVIVIMNAHP
jgi:hypothetical protein